MKSLMLLWQEVLTSCGDLCRISTTADAKTARRRSDHEGSAFFTLTLPNFAADFEKSLEQGKVLNDTFPGFRKRGGLPLFLGGFLEHVFDRGTGVLLDSPNVDAIFAVRQITRLYSKIEIECTERRVRKSIEGYLQTEQDVRDSDAEVIAANMARFHRIAALCFSEVSHRVEYSLDSGELLPKHGPGATSDRLRGNAKYYQSEWPQRLDHYFPMEEYLIPSFSYFEKLEPVTVLDPVQERPSRLATVPKTVKTPRLIAIEPTCMQYTQQGLSYRLVEALEADNLVGPLIGFSDQNPNRVMAAEGSFTGELATLDLSEASDRVSNQHVLALFANYHSLNGAVQACRTRKVDVPGHGVKRLAKFASMGSALTFPIEAMVFLTVVLCGIERELGRPLTPKDLKSFRHKVRIYGDDIIVPVDMVHTVVSELNTFGYKVNASKSFWNGSFRESCGKEYYEGIDVSIVKVRRVFPTQRQDVKEIVSLCSLRNQFYWLGMWTVAKWLDTEITKFIKLPKIGPESSALGRHTVLPLQVDGFDADTQVPLIRAHVVHSELPTNPVSDFRALLKWFLKRGDEPFALDHLERSGRPERVSIKLRWVQPY
jgi:hypothetical protein